MKKLLLIFVALTLGVATYGQTVARSVMANTNGVVISPTNFWQQAPFTNATRESLGLGWPALTNTNAATSLLGYDTNGQVVANTGTNVLTFTNDVRLGNGDLTISGMQISGSGISLSFEDGNFAGDLFMDGAIFFGNATNSSTTRTNLGLGATWLTNTDVTNFRTAIGLGATNTVFFGGLGVGSIDVVGQAIINGELLLEEGATISFGDGKATTRTNLGLGATWLTNTNVTNFRTAIGLGATNSVTFANIQAPYVEAPYFFVGDGTNGIVFESTNTAAITRTNLGLGGTNYVEFQSANIPSGVTVGEVSYLSYGINASGWGNGLLNFEESKFYSSSDSDWDFGSSGIYNLGNLSFSTSSNTATTRTNLGLGATWLTNTNVTNFRTAIGLGATNIPTFDGVNVGADLDITLFGITGWDAEIDLEEKDLTAGSGYDWNLGGSGFNAAGTIAFVNSTNAATTRTNLGLGATWLTNTDAASFRTAIGSTTVGNAVFIAANATAARTAIGATTVGESLFTLQPTYSSMFLRINADNTVSQLSASDFRTALSLGTAATNPSSAFQPAVNSTNAATTRTNLGLGATWLTNTNVTNFRSAIGLGWAELTNTSADNFRNAIELSRTNNAYFSGVGVGRSADGYVMQGTAAIANQNNGFAFTKSGIPFLTISNLDGGTNGGALIFHGSAGAAITRTNLGLGWPALTNTNAANFRTAIGLGATNDVTFNTFNTVTAGVSPFLQIGNYLAPANTNEGDNTFFRIGIAEDTDRTAQIGYRAGGPNSGRGGFISLDFFDADYLFQLSHDAMVPELWTGAEPVKLVSFGDPIAVHRSLQINSGDATVLKLNNPGTYAVDFLVADESLSVGYDAPQWSVGSDMNGFRVKYGLNNIDWGKVLYLDRDNDGGVARSAMGVAPAPIFKVLTNDFSITNQTNMTVVDGLTISTEAGKAYVFELFPIVSASSGSTSLQIVASNATVYGNWDEFGAVSYSTNLLTNAIISSITAARVLIQKFYVTANTNAGTISFQFSSTVGTNTNTIAAGSYMMAQEVVPTP